MRVISSKILRCCDPDLRPAPVAPGQRNDNDDDDADSSTIIRNV